MKSSQTIRMMGLSSNLSSANLGMLCMVGRSQFFVIVISGTKPQGLEHPDTSFTQDVRVI